MADLKRFAKDKLKKAQSSAGKTLKAAQQSQTATRVRAGQTKVANRVTGRSNSQEDISDTTILTGASASSIDSLQAHSFGSDPDISQQQGSSTFTSTLEPPNCFATSGSMSEQHKRHLPAQLQHVIAPNFGTDDSNASEEEELEQQTRQVIDFVRDDWIRAQMSEREPSFTEYRRTTVLVGSWNVNGKKAAEDLDAWLGVSNRGHHKDSAGAALPDIYVVGFQEIVDLNAANVMSDGASRERSTQWAKTIGEAINRTAKYHHSSSAYASPDRYVLLSERHMVGIMICVFVLEKHRMHVRDLQDCVAGTGVMGVIGNKGAAAVRFRLYDSTFCFVCAHMAAHRDNVDARNADFHNILSKVSFKDDPNTAGAADRTIPQGIRQITSERQGNNSAINHDSPATSSSSPANNNINSSGSSNNININNINYSSNNASYGILEHDYVFWFGDFNYRIDSRFTVEEVSNKVDAMDFEWLREFDQLNIERAAGRCFGGFHEYPVHFMPTYKYQAGTDFYDRRPDKKMRAPAWCDRILHCTPRRPIQPHSKTSTLTTHPSVTLIDYTRCELRQSDHKPVVGHFGVVVKRTDPVKRRDVIADIVRTLDQWENDQIPKLTILDHESNAPASASQALSFSGGVRYRTPAYTMLRFTNTGQVPVVWRFAPKLDDRVVCKLWLNLSQEYGMLLPGTTQEIVVSCFVDTPTARTVLSGTDFLDDILILRVEHGRDHFVSVSAQLLRTCFGQDMSKLVSNPFPVRLAPSECHALARAREAKMGTARARAPLPVPKEIWRLVNHLHLHGGCHEPLIFQSAGKQSELQLVRECLDTGLDIPPPPDCSLHAVATALVDLVHSFPFPVVPRDLYPAVDFDAVPVEQWASRLVDQLPPLNHNVLVYILLFLRELLQPSNSSRNRVHAGKLGQLFAGVLFDPPATSSGSSSSSGQPTPWVRGWGSADAAMSNESNEVDESSSSVNHDVFHGGPAIDARETRLLYHWLSGDVVLTMARRVA